MKLTEGKNWKLYNGNMLDMLSAIELNSIDSIVTDPPYELGFMGKGWDRSGIAFQQETWERCFDVLKPGGYLLAFGGSRTFHRIACAIEDAGFEIRDTIMWLYGSGFPKSMNIGITLDKKNEFRSEWTGWGTALKPSYEPIIVARKLFKGSCVDNVLKNGVGGINIDECRVENSLHEDIGRVNKSGSYKSGRTWNTSNTPGIDSSGRYGGRYPANTILTYDDTDFDEVCGGFPVTTSGIRTPTGGKILNPDSGWNNNSMIDTTVRGFNDSGSASRYFYCAKASKRDRDEGLEMKNNHPTVKPTSLMQYLVRLVTPKGGTILDPFNGSGSTGKAVMYENKDRNANYKYIGIELTEEYIPIAQARIEYATQH